jgi:hypothetical protein
MKNLELINMLEEHWDDDLVRVSSPDGRIYDISHVELYGNPPGRVVIRTEQRAGA